MTERPGITKIDQNDARVVAAAEAERRFFEYYGLDFNVHYVDLKQPNMRVRVLDVGSREPVLMVPGGTGDAFWFASTHSGTKRVAVAGGEPSWWWDERWCRPSPNRYKAFRGNEPVSSHGYIRYEKSSGERQFYGRIVVILAGSGSPARRVGWPRWPSRPSAWPSIGYEVPPFVLIVLVRAALV